MGEIIKKRTITEFEIPEPVKKISNKEIVYDHLLVKGKKTHTQIMNETTIKSDGNLVCIMRNLMEEKRVKKETCKCCGVTEQYEAI